MTDTGTYLIGQKAIADYLRCSPSTFKRWVRAAGLPVFKMGVGRTGKVAAARENLDRWIRKRERELRVSAARPVKTPKQKTGAASRTGPATDLRQ